MVAARCDRISKAGIMTPFARQAANNANTVINCAGLVQSSGWSNQLHCGTVKLALARVPNWRSWFDKDPVRMPIPPPPPPPLAAYHFSWLVEQYLSQGLWRCDEKPLLVGGRGGGGGGVGGGGRGKSEGAFAKVGGEVKVTFYFGKAGQIDLLLKLFDLTGFLPILPPTLTLWCLRVYKWCPVFFLCIFLFISSSARTS